MDITREKVLDSAYRALANRAHSMAELKVKLLRKDYPDNLVEEVLAECSRLGFIGDEDFARQYCEELKYRRYGTRKIELYMFKKGLDKDLIQKTIEDQDSASEQIVRAREAVSKKMKSFLRESDVWKRKQKIYRFLASRGFTSNIISRVIDGLDLLSE